MSEISQSLNRYQSIRARIVAVEGALDEATLADTLDGVTDLHEVVAAVVRAALVDQAMAEGVKAHIETLHDRMARLETRAAARRLIARDAMLEVGLKKVAAPD